MVRNGYLVLEEYFDGHAADGLHTQQSVSKSFTSALIGIAIEQGKMRGVDEKGLGFFPEMQGIEHRDERKEAMTLGDLLTMRSGTDYHEGSSNSPHSQLNRLSKGWDRFVLDRPMLRQPGSRFQYDSGGVMDICGGCCRPIRRVPASRTSTPPWGSAPSTFSWCPSTIWWWWLQVEPATTPTSAARSTFLYSHILRAVEAR